MHRQGRRAFHRGDAVLHRLLHLLEGAHLDDQADAIFSRGIVLVWVVAYFLTRAAFPLALAVGSSGDRTILPAGLSRVTLLSPILWAS